MACQAKEKDIMTCADKKKWTTPKLRIFARTGTEERVLAACKGNGQSAQYTNQNSCRARLDTLRCTAYDCLVIGFS